jgi:SAM-dependent methyltransferase
MCKFFQLKNWMFSVGYLVMQPYHEQVEIFSPNEVTLGSYELGIQEYIAGTEAHVSGHFKAWLDYTLTCLQPHSRIIEIGSGFGRDAKYIESCGFNVERTDATLSFVAFLQQEGYLARHFNILTDVFEAQYDLIFANAVFLHFTPQELEGVFGKILNALNRKGILAFSVKKGEGEGWTTAKLGRPRYFCYWTTESLCEKLKLAGFKALYTSEDDTFIRIAAQPES